MPKVMLPPGCYGLEMGDGTRIDRRRNAEYAEVTDKQASAIRRNWAGQSGVLVVDDTHHIGTRNGRWCTNCKPTRVWNAWNISCPKCGAATVLEEQQ